MPAALVAATILFGTAGPAVARSGHHRHRPAESHVSLHVSGHSLLSGRQLVVRGRVRPGGAHRVKVVVRGPAGGLSTTTTNRGGAFRMSWGLPHTGTYAVRAFGVHDRSVSGSKSVARHFTVFRHAVASYYGPGLYGNGVACGGTLEPSTLGVASKTLPCGARVTFRYHGRTVTVPVIDRGPYVAGRDFDLTEAAKQRLGFPGVDVLLASR
jgi:hypothetical protein